MNQNQNDSGAGLLLLVGLSLTGLGVHKTYAGGVGRFLADLAEALRRAKETPQMAASVPSGEIPIGARTLLKRRRRVRHRLTHLRGRRKPTARTLLHVPPKQIAAAPPEKIAAMKEGDASKKSKRGGRTSLNRATLEKLKLYDGNLSLGMSKLPAIDAASKTLGEKYRLFGAKRARFRRSIAWAVEKYRA
jgi:hypothetical protein